MFKQMSNSEQEQIFQISTPISVKKGLFVLPRHEWREKSVVRPAGFCDVLTPHFFAKCEKIKRKFDRHGDGNGVGASLLSPQKGSFSLKSKRFS